MTVRTKDERGQAFVLTALSLVMLCAMCAFVLDVGSWYRQKGGKGERGV